LSTLNPDQVETISRKPEVTTSIRELEEIQKQLVLFEAELQRENREQAKLQEKEIKENVSLAVENTLVSAIYLEFAAAVCPSHSSYSICALETIVTVGGRSCRLRN
jgi:hypothetical protein